MTATIDLVRAFYAALGRGDVPGLLGLLHPDLEWTEAEGFPYYSGTWREPGDVLSKLIAPLMRDWDNFSAVADDFIAEGDRVVSLGVYRGVNKATGKAMRAPFAHVWRVTDGKLKRFDMYADTLLIARAMQP
nr:nuclear transport factor 2 family protein [uncultured Rhodopila sp.]